MALTITENAAAEVKKIMTEQEFDPATMLRIGVVSGGCSGLNYSLNLDGEFDETKDNRYEQHGVTVVVDKKSSLYLDQTTVDFYESIEARGFQFKNPQAKKTCGCGQSFHT